MIALQRATGHRVVHRSRDRDAERGTDLADAVEDGGCDARVARREFGDRAGCARHEDEAHRDAQW